MTESCPAATASNPGPPNASMRLISGDQRGRTRRGGFGICRIAIISTTSCATPATETEADEPQAQPFRRRFTRLQGEEDGHEDAVHEDRRSGRHRHAALGVQQCTGYGSQSRRRDERKHQPRVVGGEPETQGIVDIAGRQCQHEHRGDDFGQCHDDEQPERQRGECFSGQDPCRIIALLGPNAVLDRDDAAVQNSLAQHAPREARKAEGDHERIRGRSCAQDRGQQDVTHKAKHPGRCRGGADDEGGAGEGISRHCLTFSTIIKRIRTVCRIIKPPLRLYVFCCR